MLKEDAIRFFGDSRKTAIAVGISRQGVNDWPAVLPRRIADRVIAAAVRAGREVPPEFLNKPLHDDSARQQKAAA